MNRRLIITTLCGSFLVASCMGNRPEPAVAPSTPAEYLEAILATPITFRQDSLYRAFEADQGADIRILLPTLALDTSAPALARANAVLRMGAIPMADWDVYASTIQDPDPRVRGATLSVVGPLATRDLPNSLPIIAVALVDPEIGIQAKALQELRDRDLSLLRFYIDRDPPAELREIAIQMLRNAEAWGAPLEPEADGTLRRVAPAGVELSLRPDTAFPEFDLVIGALTVTPPGRAPREIADSVESVATIIPAVVDATGRYVVLETARRIEVHDLETGRVSVLGAGVAPRPMPLTPDYLYFREIERSIAPDGSTIRYEMMRAPFEGGAGVPFDTINLALRPGLRGYLSPLRWARIHDRGTAFVVNTDGLRNHRLPSPFDGPAE